MTTARAAMAILVLSLATGSEAQETTAAGLEAFAQGDYARAAGLLQPIAESTGQRNPVAAFFLATMYENGNGVAMDPIHACALYSRASFTPSPFSRAADDLLQAMRERLSGDQFQDCVWLANTGFDHRFIPVIFELEPGHWIRFDLRSVTIEYAGREKKLPGIIRQGVTYLPLEHVELQGRGSSRRHFVEAFLWVPIQGGQWRLMWQLYEVVRDNFTSVAHGALAEAPGDRAPLTPSVDVHDAVRLQVNDRGDVEWNVVVGPERGTGVIESDEERRAAEERSRARREADNRVDWKRTGDPERAPMLSYVDGDTCGSAIYTWSADRMEAMAVRFDRALVDIGGRRTFDLAGLPPGLELSAHVYKRATRTFSFCTDVHIKDEMPQSWRAVRGSLTISLTPAPDVRRPSAFRATIQVEGAEFVSSGGSRAKQSRPIVLTGILADR